MRRACLLALIAACALAQAVLCARAEGGAVPEYFFQITVLEDEQALHVNQTVKYVNNTGARLSYVIFSAYGNCFRRESALPYDNETLEKAFPYGYAPGGLDFERVLVNGAAADWGAQGAEETFLRVGCDLEPGEACEFAFVYTVLLSNNRAFLGAGDADWRLSCFYPSLCPYEYGDFTTNALTRTGQSLYAERANFTAEIALPPDYDAAFGGTGEWSELNNGYRKLSLTLENARDLTLSIGRKFHAYQKAADSGALVCVYGRDRAALRTALNAAVEALNQYEKWFGAYPYGRLSIVQSAYAAEAISGSGVILMGEDVFSDADALRRAVRARVARQFFGDVALPNPALEAWLIEAPSEYAALCLIEETEGADAFASALGAYLLPSLQLTIPGGLSVDSYTARFTTSSEYDIVARDRGAAVLHELRLAMGREAMLSALAGYLCENRFGQPSIADFASALRAATGRAWDDALLSYLYTIDEYAQGILDAYD